MNPGRSIIKIKAIKFAESGSEKCSQEADRCCSVSPTCGYICTSENRAQLCVFRQFVHCGQLGDEQR